PATKPEDIERLSAATGRNEDGLVVHEPFRQWVVEDDFVGGERPDLGAAGVELVSDVAVYEHMKLRMLNGAHSSLAYLGYLSGHKTIADTMADEALAGFVTRLWSEEIIPALTPPPGVDLAGYAAALKARFANTGIRHLTWQIAMDGSQKLPQRILATLGENLKAGRSSPRLMLAVAAWMRYVGGVDETGAPIEVK
ncbi:MAG: mannitol dehydrogenase family protein, partial [Hyphomonas sp.]